MTGLTKDGQAVASSRYHLYGASKTSTDTTGNPFAYNSEARDDSGLDYLRARYYDSQGGTFLSEDSYPGEATDPLSQNRYSYVQNNPVNYTDPSGHFWSSIKKGWNYVKKTASNAWNGVKRVASNTWNTVKRVASNTWNGVKSFASKAWNATKSAFNHATNWVSTQYNRAVNWGSRQWNKVQTAYNSASDYVQTKYQQTVAQIEAKRQQVVRSAYALATGLSSSPTIREGMNLLRNWGTALQNTLKHVCTTAERIKNQVVDFVKNVDWKKVAIVAAATVAAVAVSVATAGAAAPVVAGLVGSVGLTGFGAAVATGVGVGVLAGAAGGGTQALVSGVLSGKDGKTILKDTLEGIKGGAVTGVFTGGLTGGLGAASSSVTNSLVRHGVDTVGETVIDTISDATQGGQITPTSIGTSLLLNAVTEGVSSRTVGAPKADVVTTKPTGGRLPMTVENLQMFAKKPGASVSKARYGESKLSAAEYKKLRDNTPTPNLRMRVNEGISLPMNDFAIPGNVITKKLEADHIVPMKKIVTMEGFDKLSSEQQLSVLNFEENFIGLSKSANTSKGAKSYSDWTMYKKTNTPINPIFREEMIRKEAILEGKLQSMIDNFIYDK